MGCCQVLQRPEFGGAESWDRVGGVVVLGRGCVPFQPQSNPPTLGQWVFRVSRRNRLELRSS